MPVGKSTPADSIYNDQKVYYKFSQSMHVDTHN